MALENCPACERDFKTISDYPRIYLARVAREAIPDDTRFPLGFPGFGIFVDPEEKRRGIVNPAVPTAVMELLAGKPKPEFKILLGDKENEVEYHGWQWTRNQSRYYRLSNNDQTGLITKIVLFRLNKYLGRLEERVGQEVPRDVLIPPSLPIGYRAEFAYDLGVTDEDTGLNRIILHVNHHAGGTIYMVEPVVQVATIDYEGRLNH